MASLSLILFATVRANGVIGFKAECFNKQDVVTRSKDVNMVDARDSRVDVRIKEAAPVVRDGRLRLIFGFSRSHQHQPH